MTKNSTTILAAARIAPKRAQSLVLLRLLLLLLLVSFRQRHRYGVVQAVGGGISAKTGGGAAAPGNAAGASSGSSPKATVRKKNLDFFDAPTLTYYLDLPAAARKLEHPEDVLPEYDVAVLFYAPWDRNSIALAGTWDKIATLLKAGADPSSKLILGVFDCEYDLRHSDVCTRIGITHYPTILYFSMAYNHKLHKPKKPTKRNPNEIGVVHMSKFKGNWQYGDAILDWLKTMRALCQWHRSNIGDKVRSILFPWIPGGTPNKKKRKPKELPIGIPSSPATAVASAFTSGSGTGTGGGDAFTEVQLRQIEAALQKEKDATKQMKDVAIRSTYLIESLLFPKTMPMSHPYPTKDELRVQVRDKINHKNYTDAFQVMNITNAWESFTNDAKILSTCIQDLALDYCDRFKLVSTETFLQEQSNIVETTGQAADYKQLQVELQAYFQRPDGGEPYCMILEECVLSKFKDPKCKPSKCPFQDTTACRYLSACFLDPIQDDYRKALGINETSTSKTKTMGTAGGATTKPIGKTATASVGTPGGSAFSTTGGTGSSSSSSSSKKPSIPTTKSTTTGSKSDDKQDDSKDNRKDTSMKKPSLWGGGTA